MQNPLDQPLFKRIARVCQKQNRPAWVVGGFVRDILLNRASKDIDIVVLGSGVDAAKDLSLELGKDCSIAVFKNFGTAQVKYQDYVIEFIGARKESYNRDSRNPVVETGTLEDDQLRRDFTINSLYLSLNGDDYGSLIDPFGGVQDIQDRRLVTPTDPNTTFSDDPLRMLRAIRFAARLDFDIDPITWEAIKSNAERIRIVSAERISDELNAMIMGDTPSKAFNLLFDSQLLHIIFPELAAMQGVETISGKSHKDNFYHTLQVLDQLCRLSDNLWLRWAAILHDIAKPATKRFEPKVGWTFHGHEDRGARMVKGIFRRMRLPLDDKMKFVEKMVAMHLRPIVLSQEIVTDSAVRRLIVEAGEDIDSLMLLCQSDITSKNERKVQRHLENLQKVYDKIQDVRERDELRNWQPVLTGHHIMQHFHINKPQQIGQLKEATREAILEGIIGNTLEESLTFCEKLASTLGIATK
ncbi:MAG: hypothetical protein RL577_449 [Bacteroidota bacterium]